MKQLNQILELIASELNLATNKKQAIELNLHYYLNLDYNSVYGGYRLINVAVDGGGHFGAFGGSSCDGSSCDARRTKKEMESYLEGLYNGVKYLEKVKIDFAKKHVQMCKNEIANDYEYYLEGQDGAFLNKDKFNKEAYPEHNIL